MKQNTPDNDEHDERILWIRKLSCGHERATNIAFMCKNYIKPIVGDNCYCRECCKEAKITGVRR